MKKRPTTVFALIRDTIIGDRVKKQYERVEASIKAKAQAVSDAEFNRTMANFYTERVLALDPHNIDQVWDFADAKQKQHDHQHECIRFEAKVDELQARVAAETQRFTTLQEKINARPEAAEEST